MKYLDIIKILKDKHITVFTTRDFAHVSGLSAQSAWAALGRYTKSGLLTSPKRGVYYISENPPHEYALANFIYAPSYVSFETALSHYGIIPEVVYSITSATTKATRQFESDGKLLTYVKIKMKAYTGYRLTATYLIADPEKALADYLYFVALGKKKYNDRLTVRDIQKDKLRMYAGLFAHDGLNRLVVQLSL